MLWVTRAAILSSLSFRVSTEATAGSVQARVLRRCHKRTKAKVCSSSLNWLALNRVQLSRSALR